MQNADSNPVLTTAVRTIAAREWQQLIDAVCRDSQVATARICRTEGMLQLGLEVGAVDVALLLQWGTQAAQRLAVAIPNPLWPDSVIGIHDEGEVRIVMLHKRAPVYVSTRDGSTRGGSTRN